MDKPIKKLTHQEILRSKPSVEEVGKKARTPLTLVLENIRSLYNIGSIFRTADALLVEKIYLCGISGTPPNHEIEKVALGAVETVPFEYRENCAQLLQELREQGKGIMALEITHQSEHYRKVKYKFPLVLVAGNEVDGVSEAALEQCQGSVMIPMLGRANSLNVATATAVVGYEVFDQFNNQSPEHA
jgi:tRNA G18 (ribose-2'-O)-methylase SpoU